MREITQVNIYITLFYSIVIFQYEVRRWFKKWLRRTWWRDEASFTTIEGKLYKASVTVGLRNKDRFWEWWAGRKRYVFQMIADYDRKDLLVEIDYNFINVGLKIDGCTFVEVGPTANFYMDNFSIIEINKNL